MSETAAKGSEWVLPSAGVSHGSSAETFGSRAPAPAGVASRCSSGASVLVVEDDRGARRAMALILKRHGFAVCEAGTVAEAMAALGAKPGWVLLDLLLPDGCGIDVLK